MTTETYTNLITSQYKNSPKFVAQVSITAAFYARMQDILSSFKTKFDLDVAVGHQLDVIGEWVNASREVPIPITGVYFEWDEAEVGWELGSWKGEFDPDSGLAYLPNDVYRTYIKTKIAANKWNGTIPQAYEIYQDVFPEGGIVIQDNQDMTMVVGIFGAPPNAILKALLIGGFLALKPEGVKINYALVPIISPLFGWDIESEAIDGWDIGSWPEEY